MSFLDWVLDYGTVNMTKRHLNRYAQSDYFMLENLTALSPHEVK